VQFIRDLTRRWGRWFTVATVSALIPRFVGWLAGQWAGNKSVEFLERHVFTKTNVDMISVVWHWMAAHPLSSVFYSAGALLSLFSIETKVYEYRHRRKSAPLGAATSAAVPADSQVGDDGISVGFREHNGGLVVEVKQAFDPLKAQAASVGLDDIRKIDGEVLSTTPEFQRPDGMFNYAGGILDNAQPTSGHLYWNVPQSWWLVKNNSRVKAQIHYEWGDRPGGWLELQTGDWEIGVRITVGDKRFTKKVRCSWSGSGAVTVKA
jgi:hypothetical protein